MPNEPIKKLGIVVVPICDDAALLRCLRSVAEVQAQLVVVAAQLPEQAVQQYMKSHSVQLVDGEGLSVPERRAAGIVACTCEWIALLEDSCSVEPGWMEAAIELSSQDVWGAATGPIFLSPSLGAAELALACSEYGRFTPRQLFKDDSTTTRAVARTVGVNMLYRNSVLEQHLTSAGLIESELDTSIAAHGIGIVAHRKLAVLLEAQPRASVRLLSRLRHGRLYGGLLARRSGPGKRLANLAKCFALPFVLSRRSLRALPAQHASRRAAIRYILGLELAWSLGELIGTLAGPGDLRSSWN